jgi:thiamine-monophosphate kinase
VLELERLPIASSTRATAAALGAAVATLALSGGEDYELLCIAQPSAADALADAVAEAGGALTRIGTILAAGAGRWLEDAGGRRASLDSDGWQHFHRP